MRVDGVKIDCHACSKSFYINKDLMGSTLGCPICLSPDILAYNEANIYIGKLLEEVEGE